MIRLIFGCGYLGFRVARRWRTEGGPVFAVTRSQRRAAELRREGLQPIVADVTRPSTLTSLPPADTVLYAVGYDRLSGRSRKEVYVDGLRNVLAALSLSTRRLLYVSSTGVYGSAAGDWVDEDTPCRPCRAAGAAMLAAEEVLWGHRLGSQAMILRMAGIYGPGRIARMADLIAGRPIEIEEGGHLNLIQVDDAATVVIAAETRSVPPRVYTISDGYPCRRREFYRCLAALLDLPEPEFLALQVGRTDWQRASDDKRVGNSRMLRELEVHLQYPSYKEGLAALVAGQARS